MHPEFHARPNRRALLLTLLATVALTPLLLAPVHARADYYSDGLTLNYNESGRISINLPIDEGYLVGSAPAVPYSPVAAWHYPGTAWPGQGNKVFLFSHDQPGYFDQLTYAQVGDRFSIQRPDGRSFVYTVQVNETVTYNDPSLTAPTGYDEVVLFTCTSWGDTDPKRAVIAYGQVVAPDPPTNVSAVAGNGSALVTWKAPLIVGWTQPISYLVTASPGGMTMSAGPNATSLNFTGLSNSTAYSFSVSAVNAVGPSSAGVSNTVFPYAPPLNASVHQQSYFQSSAQNSAASTWFEVDPGLRRGVTVGTGQAAIVGANMALWTVLAGYNQDLGIFKFSSSGVPCDLGGAGNPNLLAWKESGGFGGTYSPNAAFVQAVLTNPGQYTVTLCWKANKAAPPNTIYGAAGTAGTYFSPTILTVKTEPAANLVTAVTNQSYSLMTQQPDAASTWYEIDPALRVTYTAPAGGGVLLDGNMDLWTARAGFNQDIGIFSGTDCALNHLLAWKESGGFAGTLSPNAALVESLLPVSSGGSYTFTLCWKANKPAPAGTVFGAAGTADTYFSPTRLSLEFLPTGSYQASSSAQSFHLDAYQPDIATNWYLLSPQPFVTSPPRGPIVTLRSEPTWTSGRPNRASIRTSRSSPRSMAALRSWWPGQSRAASRAPSRPTLPTCSCRS